MPSTKNETILLAYSLVFGLLAGFCISAMLQAIAAPTATGFLLNIQEHTDLTILAAKASSVQLFINLGIAGGLVYLILLLPVLNPNINLGLFKQPQKIIRVLVYIFAALLVTIGLSARLDSFFGDMNSSLFIRFVGVTIPIVWWAILGEIGIAGDLSTWKPRHNPDIRTCILLAVSSYFIFIILSLADSWGFQWFFTLVSEVLGGSGEFSITGFTWLQGWLIFLASSTSVCLTATIIALAPSKRELYERTNKLTLPIGMTISFTLLLCAGYYYGVFNYDLGQPSLTSAIGSQASSPEDTQTALLLGRNDITSSPWQTSIVPFSMTETSPLTASEKNSRLLREYLQNKPQSIHRYSAEDALVKIHFNLWDSSQTTILQQQTQNTIIQRLIFLNRLGCLPVTTDNSRFLLEYENDAKWWVGNKAALLLAQAAIHFNQYDKAGRWLAIAKERGATEKALTAITIPEQPQLTTGTITGSITTDRPLIIALFQADDKTQQVVLDTTYLSLNLVDTRAIDQTSTFSFTNIGTGRYFLALKYEGDVTEIAMKEIKVIELDNEQSKIDVGVITIGM